MKKLLLIVVALAGSALAADKKIPGTSVSYKVQSAGGKNTSMVFVDALNDRTGKTYLAVKCGGGSYTVSLHSRDVLATSEGPVQIIVSKGGTLNRGDGVVRVDRQTGKLTVWDALGDANEGLLVTMANTKGTVSLNVQREGLKPVSYTFNTNGILAGLDAVKKCH